MIMFINALCKKLLIWRADSGIYREYMIKSRRTSATLKAWQNPERLIILYSLYRFAECANNLHSDVPKNFFAVTIIRRSWTLRICG